MKQENEDLAKRIANAEVELDAAKCKLSDANRRLAELKKEYTVPTLKEKYEGRYFKCTNSYGTEDSWYIYSHCNKVLSDVEGLFDTFETDYYNEHRFKVNEACDLFIAETEIKELEYREALYEFQKKMGKIVAN